MTTVEYYADFKHKFASTIKDKAKLVSIDLGFGNVESMEDYKYQCGIIKGLDLALDLLDMLIEEERKGN